MLQATTLPEKLVEADELPSPLAQEVQSGSNPGLTLTIRGKPQVIPLHEISKLSFPDFAKLYSVSIFFGDVNSACIPVSPPCNAS